jgi:hypothetical protein
MAVYNKKIDKHAVDIYEDIMKTAKMPGVAGTGDKSKLAGYFEDAWADVYNAEGRGTKEIMEGLGTRAETLVRGVSFGGTWKLDTRKKVMVAALVAAHIAMVTDANLEKYATCGSGTMCLHFPRYFGDDNNMAYELGEPVMSDYKGLVMTKYPDDKRDRFHIMSPCKADLVVEAHDDDGFCKCEELYEADKVYYKMQKFMCLAEEKVMAVPINADGTCPETYMYKGTEYEISVDTDVYEMGSFTCDADEDQEECIFRNTHDDPCTNDIYGDRCLKIEYRNCYGSDRAKKCAGTAADYSSDCDGEGHCVGVYSVAQSLSNFHPAIAASTHQDTFAVPVNMKPHVNVDKSSETVNICKNSWASDFLGKPGEFAEPCVSVAYDVVSMRGYSKEGFGVNYCGENKAQFNDKLEKTCFWGAWQGQLLCLHFQAALQEL